MAGTCSPSPQPSPLGEGELSPVAKSSDDSSGLRVHWANGGEGDSQWPMGNRRQQETNRKFQDLRFQIGGSCSCDKLQIEFIEYPGQVFPGPGRRRRAGGTLRGCGCRCGFPMVRPNAYKSSTSKAQGPKSGEGYRIGFKTQRGKKWKIYLTGRGGHSKLYGCWADGQAAGS